MSSIDDWENKLDKPPKKYDKSFSKNKLDALTQLCRRSIVTWYAQGRHLTEYPEWIFPGSVASRTKSNLAFVSIVLGKLEKAGLLFPSESFPIDREVHIGHDYRGNDLTHVFKDGCWFIKKFKRKVSGFKRQGWPEFKSKIIYIKSNWNGKARRINTQSELFHKTCIEFDIHPDVIQDWLCSCGKKNWNGDKTCCRCRKERIFQANNSKEKFCKLCGMPYRRHGRKQTEHTREVCLNKMIKLIHEK